MERVYFSLVVAVGPNAIVVTQLTPDKKYLRK